MARRGVALGTLVSWAIARTGAQQAEGQIDGGKPKTVLHGNLFARVQSFSEPTLVFHSNRVNSV